MQVEYTTRHEVFRSATTLKPLYERLARESVLSIKAEQIARLPRPSDHHSAGPGDWVSALHPDRRNLHQAPVARPRSRYADEFGEA